MRDLTRLIQIRSLVETKTDEAPGPNHQTSRHLSKAEPFDRTTRWLNIVRPEKMKCPERLRCGPLEFEPGALFPHSTF